MDHTRCWGPLISSAPFSRRNRHVGLSRSAGNALGTIDGNGNCSSRAWVMSTRLTCGYAVLSEVPNRQKQIHRLDSDWGHRYHGRRHWYWCIQLAVFSQFLPFFAS